jgi:enamine deaminase RidA (YjgF/YER057c/UK114 family)
MLMTKEPQKLIKLDVKGISDAEKSELHKLGLLNGDQELEPFVFPENLKNKRLVEKHAVHAAHTLNEAYNYQKPSSFSRALRLDFGDYRVILISGTASVDENGASVHIGDFRAQCWRTFRNISELLKAEDMTWHDVVRTSCYLRDISRDYDDFNKVRTMFYTWLGLDPLPASTGIQATICREDLLVEIEAIAVSYINK